MEIDLVDEKWVIQTSKTLLKCEKKNGLMKHYINCKTWLYLSELTDQSGLYRPFCASSVIWGKTFYIILIGTNNNISNTKHFLHHLFTRSNSDIISAEH